MSTPGITDAPILIIDDDEIVLLALTETLTLEGYTITAARSALEGLEFIKSKSYSVILSDQLMPEMTGLEFFSQVKEIQPNTSRILITGALNLKTIMEAINKSEVFRVLAKPWTRDELIATVQYGVQRYQSLEVNRRLQEQTRSLNHRLIQANSNLEIKVKTASNREQQLDAAHQALEHNFDHSLELCYRIINTYHPLLGKETKAIVDICTRMANTGLIDPKQAHVLKVSAWLQNIGLLGVSRAIITKSREAPDSLTANEELLIRNHPIYGQTISPFVDSLADVGVTIRAHHERWDGGGYPDGLALYSIPEAARYLAVAVYFVECGLPREEAVEAVLQESGKALDPEAVRLFLKSTQPMQLPRRIKEVILAELNPGMVLAKGVYSPSGLLLIPEDTALNEKILKKVIDHNFSDPINQRLLVYV